MNTAIKRLQMQDTTIAIGNQTICHHLNLAIHAGEIWGILGANGSGKTTLLHTLAGLYPVLSDQRGQIGQIWLYESNLKKCLLKNLTPRTIAQSIAILFQHVTDMFPQTVWDYCKASRYPHLTYFTKESSRDLDIVAQALYAMDLQLLTQRCITQLSGGEKRRLALACVLAQTPVIYLLDEPTNHLDVRHQVRVLHHFRQLATVESAAVMMSLHDVNLAQRYCTHSLLLFPNGETLQGPLHEVLTSANLSRLYQHKMNAIDTDHGVYWEPESGITI